MFRGECGKATSMLRASELALDPVRTEKVEQKDKETVIDINERPYKTSRQRHITRDANHKRGEHCSVRARGQYVSSLTLRTGAGHLRPA